MKISSCFLLLAVLVTGFSSPTHRGHPVLMQLKTATKTDICAGTENVDRLMCMRQASVDIAANNMEMMNAMIDDAEKAFKRQHPTLPFVLFHCLSNAFVNGACDGLYPSEYFYWQSGKTTGTGADDVRKGLGKYVFTRVAYGGTWNKVSYGGSAGKTCFFLNPALLRDRLFYAYQGDSGKAVGADTLAYSPMKLIQQGATPEALAAYIEGNKDVLTSKKFLGARLNEIVILGPIPQVYFIAAATGLSQQEWAKKAKCKKLAQRIPVEYKITERSSISPPLDAPSALPRNIPTTQATPSTPPPTAAQDSKSTTPSTGGGGTALNPTE